MLKEALEREIVKEERLKRTREEEKAAAEERLEKVILSACPGKHGLTIFLR